MMDGFGWLLLKAAAPWFLVLNFIPVMIFLERKGSALIADRVGPNRAFIPGIGLRLAGMVHNIADVVKLLTKEEFIPSHVNRRLYVAAPIMSLTIALMVGAVLPLTPKMQFGDQWFQLQAIDAGVGVLYVLSISSLAVYSVMLAGWASNNKYGLLGALRGSAQMVSYEMSMGLALVGLFVVYGTVNLNEMVLEQGRSVYFVLPNWGIFIQPIGFVLFLIAGFAETNRNPFDLPEGESEIVGFHVEYGAVKFALFFMAEYIHIVVISLLIATCYFGGWQIPWVSHETLARPGIATVVMRVVLGVVFVGGTWLGYRLLKWHAVNRTRWQDSRRNEGSVLSVALGFGPAVTAAAILLLWRGELGPGGSALFAGVLGFVSLLLKAGFFCFSFVWVRWTMPRFRYDQLMTLGWKVLIPVGLANILITGLLVKLGVW